MIVVRSNLYAGHAERARRMRPKVRAAITAVVLFAALVIFDFSQSRSLASLRRHREASERLAAQVAAHIETATANVRALEGKTARRDVILNFAAQRRNWAPLLAQAFAAVPPTVELVSLEVESAEQSKAKVRLGGKCFGAEPRTEADKCMLQIAHAFSVAGRPMKGRFISLEDAGGGIIGAENGARFAEFVMQFSAEEGDRAN